MLSLIILKSSRPLSFTPYMAIVFLYLIMLPNIFLNSRNSKLELELAQVRADFERLKSQDNTKSERLEELS